jgi:hypothetical protein
VEETRNVNRILIGKPERRDCTVDRDVDGRLILKFNLKGIFIAEINNVWIPASTLLRSFMSWCLIKHKDSFTPYFFQQAEHSL